MQKDTYVRVVKKAVFKEKLLAYMQKRLKKGTFRAKKEHFDPKKEQSRNKVFSVA